MKNIFYLFFTALCLACSDAKEQNADDDIRTFIKIKTDDVFKKNNVPGIFIGVINNDERIYYNAGYANPDTKMAFDSASIFEIGSITKTFTAYILMNVLNEKQISDSSFIITHLPDSVQSNKALGKISFFSLMNHTSGLPRLPGNLDLAANPKAPYDNYTAELLFEYLENCKPTPDGKSNYSNLGMGLAGVLAERISGENYSDLVNKYILQPFKMIVPGKTNTSTENKSQGYFGNDKIDYWNMNILSPAGGIEYSALEMLNYLQYMCEPTDGSAGKIIESLLEPTVALAPKVFVCRAWHTIEEKEKPVIYWHNGGTYGFSTFAAFIKGQQKAVIVVVNKFNENNVSDGLGIAVMKELIK